MAALLEFGNWLLPLLYMVLLADYGATFFLRSRTHIRSPWLVAVVVLHAALLVVRGIHLGHPPVTDTREILSLIALSTAAVYACVELANRDRRTGVFVILLVLLFQYTSSILLAGCWEPGHYEAAAGTSIWARLHVLPALVAYTALAFAGVYGALYLAAQRGLRQHSFGVLFDRLPPLDLLGTMTWHALLTGFIFVTLSIIFGPMLMRDTAGGMTAKVTCKIVTGSVTWLVLATAVLGRWLGRWHATRVAMTAVIGFIVVMALLIASGLLS